MSVVTIMQPAYLPWLGFFDRIQMAEKLIVLDHVTIDKNTPTQFANRNRIKLANGKPTWLTVPIKARGEFSAAPINAIPLADDPRWRRKHISSLQSAYAKAPFFAEHFNDIASLIDAPAERLLDVTEPLNRHFLNVLGIDTPVVYSSGMNPQARKASLVLELCQKAGASAYISGPFGRDYLDRSAFDAAGIELLFHDYAHPVYDQLHGAFVPYLSIVDLLFNKGEKARDILGTGREALART